MKEGQEGTNRPPALTTLTQSDHDIIRAFLSSVPISLQFPPSPGAALAELTGFSPLSPGLSGKQRFSVADPNLGSSAFLTPGSWLGKKSRSGSGMNIPDHISESLETIFWVKILEIFDANADPPSGNLFGPGSGMDKIWIRDPQHCSVSVIVFPLLLFSCWSFLV
jgi:hypothetical protein